jgi:hypothetical protein
MVDDVITEDSPLEVNMATKITTITMARVVCRKTETSSKSIYALM